MVEYAQRRATLSEPMDKIAASLTASAAKPLYTDDEVLLWMMGNVQESRDAKGAKMPCKSKGWLKIDGAVALMIAKGVHLHHEATEAQNKAQKANKKAAYARAASNFYGAKNGA